MKQAAAVATLVALLAAAGVQAQTSSSSSSASSSDGTATSSSSSPNNRNCKVVERKMNERNTSGSVSSSVSAGPGGVTSHTSGPNGVTVHSGGGSVSGSTTTTADGKTIVTASDGSCTIYVDPGKK